ncbi:hypothetical protein [Nocardia cyriacigeorgica]|uniref:hypothetical protein n=1 Tax=Nocardia cyriacigeorgica TaxID=135487 RepID=UPI00245494C0|nr:hypothetical protein [Nocardia cyriacigeorgica]
MADTDPALVAVGLTMEAMRWAFSEAQTTPPLGGGSEDVRFFAGDGLPVAAWMGHSSQCKCASPMLWVRVVRRFRTSELPDERPGRKAGCLDPMALTIEGGVMRCAVTAARPTWEQWEREAQVQLDDSFRLDQALLQAQRSIEENVAVDTMLGAGEPYGPEGGVIAWTQWIHIQLRKKS